MQSKLNYKRTFFIGLAFLSISAFWQMYDNIIPLILQNTFKIGETVTGSIMALDNVLAVFLLPIFGAVSDKVDTRFGKRTPFIVCGTALAQRRSQVVEEVACFAGHIACDCDTHSEIVVPLWDGDEIWGVLDMDSRLPGFFTEEDRVGLERAVRLLTR